MSASRHSAAWHLCVERYTVSDGQHHLPLDDNKPCDTCIADIARLIPEPTQRAAGFKMFGFPVMLDASLPPNTIRIVASDGKTVAELRHFEGNEWRVPRDERVTDVLVTARQVVVLGVPAHSEDEEAGHNCDAMGCGQSHVLARVGIPAERVERVVMRDLTQTEKWAATKLCDAQRNRDAERGVPILNQHGELTDPYCAACAEHIVRIVDGASVATDVKPDDVCTGCGAPRIRAIRAVISGKVACCPDCSTLSVDERNSIRYAVAGTHGNEIQSIAELEERLRRANANEVKLTQFADDLNDSLAREVARLDFLLRSAVLATNEDGDHLCLFLGIDKSETEKAVAIVADASGDDIDEPFAREDVPFLTDAQRARINGTVSEGSGYVDDKTAIRAALDHVIARPS